MQLNINLYSYEITADTTYGLSQNRLIHSIQFLQKGKKYAFQRLNEYQYDYL